MTAPATCTLSGTVYQGATAVQNALVRVWLTTPRNATNEPPLHVRTAQLLYTDSSGVWSLVVPQSTRARVQCGATGLDAVVEIPESASAAFEDLVAFDIRVYQQIFPDDFPVVC